MNILLKIKFVTREIVRMANSISTRPNLFSWKWKGDISIISFCLLHLIYCGRLLSLLQWVKYCYRKIARAFGWASVDKDSKRVNVPPVLVEVYFLTWMVLLLCLPASGCITRILSVYFLAESYLWILYYYFFRRFFEERYAIMHTLEYIVIMPVLIVAQASAIAVIDNLTLTGALDMILNPFESSPLYIVLLSVLYLAIIFGLVISNLPVEQVKERGTHKYNYAIIGCGYVVQKRLLPALNRLNTDNNIVIFNTAFSSVRCSTERKTRLSFHPVDAEMDKQVLSSSILWIASPSYAHISYLSRFAPDVKFLVLEKPLTSIKSELETAKRLINQFRSKIFCLSYYYLEKALPLTFLYNPLSFYEKYLNFNGSTREEVLSAFSSLGAVMEIELKLLEGRDVREWLKDDQYGGQFLETFIHLAMITKMVVGQTANLENCQWKLGDTGGRTGTSVQCTGMAGQIGFDLLMKKYSLERQRYGVVKYQRGIVRIDFERQILTLEAPRNTHTLSTVTKYGKYGIQLDMVNTCFCEGIDPLLVDGSELQLSTLDWLFSVDLSQIAHFEY